jgi:excisionase family DNA binding protein
MANVPRRERADKSMYEGKEYFTYEETADYLGIKRSTLYNYVQDLDIKTLKFKRDRRHYIALENVQKLEQVLEKPWLAGIR